ncbi:MAG: Crp/Fnr family transcriptional regulator [Candidatus Eremiobacteraeota bacterium]|nr:Crp/Fnr family transcriptional regulator [Candidatus Eremiobacteraeota bacterium]MBC5803221.1 Crp/Fnr family transcriptional regulator [Candidatus Eremiobacteraeota bacterium]MBC5823013.1 Crp/Fnr family transcriptional regulator [Candidatus Eremiobacteraeota bacterium]
MATDSNEHFDRSALLCHLRGDDRAAVAKGGTVVHFQLGETVYEAERRINEVYFPLDAILSVVTVMKDGAIVEIGSIGREGTSGIPLIMGATTTANRSVCQMAGDAWKMSAPTFRSLISDNKRFRDLMTRYLQAYVNMVSQYSACNRLHSVYQRAARWLLMTRDRVGRDEFPLTHEFLAAMLGSHRSGVTVAVENLQKAGFIQSRRGRITILDSASLREATCECYELTVAHFDAALGAAVGSSASGAKAGGRRDRTRSREA